ncbi:MAG: glycosyltransferase [Saprospiraceae bacterium]
MSDLIVSVIICTYNREKFLPDSLDSVAAQQADKNAFELVVVNNNCTDRTDDIVRQFIEKHPDLKVTYVVETKQGLSHARNRGILESKGKYVSFIDDDAIAEPDFVGQLIHFFAKNPQATAVGGPILAKYEGRSQPPAWDNKYSISLFTGHYVRGDQSFKYTGYDYPRGSNMTISKEFLEKHNLRFDPNLGRIGKDGTSSEEKILFGAIRKLRGEFYYDPSLVVHHQVDAYRMEHSFLVKLSKGLGRSQFIAYRQMGLLNLITPMMIIFFKMGAAVILAVGYLLQGKPAVSWHLLKFRWYVLLGFFNL